MLNAREISDQQAPFRLALQPPKMMTVREEIDMARRALARDPADRRHRFRLAHLLYILDGFDEAIALLEGLCDEGDDFEALHLLGAAYLARETEQDSIAAERLARRAVAAADDPRQRARALAALGKTLVRLGRIDEGRTTFLAALDVQVSNKDAYKRLAMLDFQVDRPRDALDFAETMIDDGVIHARNLGVRPLALARMGRIEEAHNAIGLDQFLRQTRLPPPPGWATIEAFNRDLAEELITHPGLRYERYGAASAKTWRVDEPALARSKLVPKLQRLIQQEAVAYVARLAADGHPWLRARPRDAFLHNWSVITSGQGYEDWHVHQNGWLSGAYYVEVPDSIANGDGPEGCIAFGLPPGIIGEDRYEEVGLRMIRPRSGMILLFPSHAFHRTFAHGSDERRICFAFDIAPEPNGS